MPEGLGIDLYRKVEAKTAAYYLKPGDIGKIFTNRGASGAVTLTLPKKELIDAGWWIEVFVVADQNLTVASYEGDNIIAANEADADSVTVSTATELIGASFKFIWDGTSWLCQYMTMETVTVTLVD